jgi:hypothetical protein
LKDSSGAVVGGIFKWWNSALVSFIPSAGFRMSAQYRLTLDLDSLKDFTGNRGGDTLWTRRFRTIDEKSVSTIGGTAADDSSGAPGAIRIVATNIVSKEIRPVALTIPAPGPFLLERVIEGKYAISGFRDADSDGVYSFGTPYPFRPAERFELFPETLKVRARWPLEGVSIRFR